ncbi:MAG: thioredoxin domain-containing protein [Pseudomonadota bacterium]
MRSLLAAAAVVIAPFAATAQAVAEDASLAAVLVYADWCGSCQTLDPKVNAVKDAGVDGVEFVTLDYTAKDAEAFYAAADEAGVDGAVRAWLGETVKTGQLLLVDLDDARVIGKVDKTMSEAEIAGALKAAAAAA